MLAVFTTISCIGMQKPGKEITAEEKEFQELADLFLAQEQEKATEELQNFLNPNYAERGVLDSRLKYAIQLVKKGANPNLKADTGETLLSMAARNSDLAKLIILIRHGANPDATNSIGQTALIVATTYGYANNVKTLLAYGADPTIKDMHGKTALDYAREYKDQIIINLLSPQKIK